MDSRFERVWHDMRDQGASEAFDRTLGSSSPERLVQALAGAGPEDARAANAIATELLNRIWRARFVGAFVATGVVALALLLADVLLTGTFGVVERDPATVDLSFLALLVGVIALGALVGVARSWRRFAGRRLP